MAKDLAIVLNNGSLASAVTAAIAAQKYRPILVYIDVTAHEVPLRRKVAYDLQVGHFKPFREHTLAMPFASLPHDKSMAGSIGSTDPRQATPLTPTLRDLVPLLGAAVTLAVAYQASAIYTGLRVGTGVDELSQGMEFTQIWNEMLQLTLGRPDTELLMPLLELEPWQVVDLGFQVNAPLERTWSCIDEHGDACGSCRGCRTRESAFMQAAKLDPLKPVRKM